MVNELRAELADLLALAHDLLHTVRPNLWALYQSQLGRWELERLKVQFAVARLKRTIELIQADINRGRKPDLPLIERLVGEDQKLWEERVLQTAADVQAAEERLGHLMDDESSAELKRLYRDLVKRLHPDLNSEQDEGSRLLWQQVQAAYEESDLEKLRAFGLLLIQPGGENAEAHAEEDMELKVGVLQKRIDEVRARIVAIRKVPPFDMEQDLLNEVWVAMKRMAIEKEMNPLLQQVAALEEVIAVLTSSNAERIQFDSY